MRKPKRLRFHSPARRQQLLLARAFQTYSPPRYTLYAELADGRVVMLGTATPSILPPRQQLADMLGTVTFPARQPGSAALIKELGNLRW